MTEYEVATLALETAQGIREQVTLVQTSADLFTNSMINSFTFFSGYIVVAHYVAAQLSRTQVILLNFLYLFIMAVNVLGINTAHSTGVLHNARLIEIDPDRTFLPFWTTGAVVMVNVLFAVCTLVSIFFFFASRRNHTPVESA